MSTQNAIEEAERRSKSARDEFEQSTKDLDAQLAAAKVSKSVGISGSVYANAFLRLWASIFYFICVVFLRLTRLIPEILHETT